ncbi:MAG TPA: hypothetical protein VJT67_07185 [Longimicrobiaceae bacterium]|nr:hypothetical protein [Longimicrobiaceae bacterium]
MRRFANVEDESGAAAFLDGAAHALDFAGAMLDDEDWRGFEADAEAIRGYWDFALASVADSLDGQGAREEG